MQGIQFFGLYFPPLLILINLSINGYPVLDMIARIPDGAPVTGEQA